MDIPFHGQHCSRKACHVNLHTARRVSFLAIVCLSGLATLGKRLANSFPNLLGKREACFALRLKEEQASCCGRAAVAGRAAAAEPRTLSHDVQSNLQNDYVQGNLQNHAVQAQSWLQTFLLSLRGTAREKKMEPNLAMPKILLSGKICSDQTSCCCCCGTTTHGTCK